VFNHKFTLLILIFTALAMGGCASQKAGCGCPSSQSASKMVEASSFSSL